VNKILSKFIKLNEGVEYFCKEMQGRASFVFGYLYALYTAISELDKVTDADAVLQSVFNHFKEHTVFAPHSGSLLNQISKVYDGKYRNVLLDNGIPSETKQTSIFKAAT
jgi:hypothetical protein